MRKASNENHYALVWQFARRDVLQRYKSTWLGLGWTFVTPLMMLLVYTFVFRDIFKGKWDGGGGGGVEFALQLYAGLLVFNLFAECLNRAPNLIVEQPNLVKKVVFPVDLLGWVVLSSALFHATLNLAVLLAGAIYVGGFKVTMLAAPLVLLPALPLLLGLVWFFAALGVYVRDVGQIMGLAVSFLMFLSPVFYPVSALPEAWRGIVMMGPPAIVIEQMRAVVFKGQWPDWTMLAIYTVVASLVGWLGHRWFALTRKGFADVL